MPFNEGLKFIEFFNYDLRFQIITNLPYACVVHVTSSLFERIKYISSLKTNMSESITIPREEYDFLKQRSNLFEQYIEIEELSKTELAQIKKALKGPFLSKAEFQKRHPHLN